jgi:hypothetical protein
MNILEELKELRHVVVRAQKVHEDKLRGPLQWDEQSRDAYHEVGGLLYETKTRADDLIRDIEIEHGAAEVRRVEVPDTQHATPPQSQEVAH